jgi:hypothetical protein
MTEPIATDTPADVGPPADDGTEQPAEETPPDDADPQDGETFPREYVQKLRGQSAKYRDRAKVADTLAARLHLELVKATGKLADPSDLPFDESHIDDPDALAEAVDELLAKKPHLASRRPTGDVGQGHRGGSSEPFSLLNLLKERT